MTVYATEHCPQCKFLKDKLRTQGKQFKVCTDIDILEQKNIKNVPMLETDQGQLLTFQQAMIALDKGVI